MLVRTVVRLYTSDKIDLIKAQMLSLGLAQNVTRSSNIEGDWVDPEGQGMSSEGYLRRIKQLQKDNECLASVEVQ